MTLYIAQIKLYISSPYYDFAKEMNFTMPIKIFGRVKLYFQWIQKRVFDQVIKK